MRKCKKCNTISKGHYCPECGEPMNLSKPVYPYKFSTYVHGNNEDDESKEEVVKELGLNEDEQLVKDIWHCDYEVKLNFEISEDGKIILISAE